MDSFASQCETMELDPTQMLDGISRVLLGALVAFETKELSVKIGGVGFIEASLDANYDSSEAHKQNE